MFFMPFIPLISPGEGLAIGIGMFIWCSGEACGFGEVAGIFMPGIISCDGPGEGDAVGIFMPGVISCDGLGDGDAVGIFIPGIISCDGPGEGDAVGIFILGIIWCDGPAVFAPAFFVAVRLAFARAFFLFGAVFGFGLLIPGILLMSCP
jgi:hypothetical protein